MHALLQASLRAALRGRRDIQSVGPFLVAFDADDASPFRNYAVPDDGANPTVAQIEDLRRAFLQWDRLPRLEFLPAAAPAVEPALLAAGFTTEARLPVLTCTAAQLRASPPPPHVTISTVADRDTLRDAAHVQNDAYGGGQPSEADVARLQRTVGSGGHVALARHADGQAIGSGIVTAPSDGIAELAAVGVLAAWRRRGTAAALTSALARAAFDGETATVMIMAAEAPEQRIYARVGFTVASEIACMSATI
jgi:ribosomal protein S18 acetylase RimI-like enzyme